MSNNYLVHHGVKGMRWGVRKKYYNEHKHGMLSLTDEGRELKKEAENIRSNIVPLSAGSVALTTVASAVAAPFVSSIPIAIAGGLGMALSNITKNSRHVKRGIAAGAAMGLGITGKMFTDSLKLQTMKRKYIKDPAYRKALNDTADMDTVSNKSKVNWRRLPS